MDMNKVQTRKAIDVAEGNKIVFCMGDRYFTHTITDISHRRDNMVHIELDYTQTNTYMFDENLLVLLD